MSNSSINAGISDMFWLHIDYLPDNFNLKHRSLNELELPGSMSIRLLECDSYSYKIDFDKYMDWNNFKPVPELYFIDEWKCLLKIIESKANLTSENTYDLLRIYGNNSTIINFLSTKNIDYFGVLNIALNDKNIDVIKILFNNGQ